MTVVVVVREKGVVEGKLFEVQSRRSEDLVDA